MIFKSYLAVPLLLLLLTIITEFLGSELTKRGTFKPRLRRLPALDAIDEAIARSTEMGRPVHFTTGYAGGRGAREQIMIAGLGVLQNVAQRCAENNTKLINTCAFGDLMPIADEAIRTGALRAGRPEWYNPDMNRFISQERYSYAMGVVGILERERPGASFLIGNVWMEALIMTEPGAALNIFQVSGCTEFAALPFLIASTDYVLISSEIYSASAYITGNEVLTGAFVGEDFGQLYHIFLLLLGVLFAFMGQDVYKILTRW